MKNDLRLVREALCPYHIQLAFDHPDCSISQSVKSSCHSLELNVTYSVHDDANRKDFASTSDDIYASATDSRHR